MVSWLVEHEDVVLAEHQPREAEPGALTAGEDRDFLLDVGPAKQQRRRPVQDLLRLCPAGGRVFQVLVHRLILRQAGINVLGIDPDAATVAPANFAGERWERIDDRSKKRRFTLAVVSHHRRPRAVLDFDPDPGGDLPFGIANRQVDAREAPIHAAVRPGAARMLTVGSSAAISMVSSFRSCFSFDFARVAVLARALFLAMNSSRCFFFASTPAFTRSSCFLRSA